MSETIEQFNEAAKDVLNRVYNKAIDHAITVVNEVREIGCDPASDISLQLVIAKLVKLKS